MYSRSIYQRAFASFGRNSVIVAPNRLRNVNRISIGVSCVIFDGAWLQAEYHSSWLTIGDRCYLGMRTHIHAVDRIEIGSGCVISDDVFVSDSEHIPGDLDQIRSRGSIKIGDGVFLGIRAVILGGVTIGAGAIIGAGSVVTRDVLAGDTVAGIPARAIRPKILSAPKQ